MSRRFLEPLTPGGPQLRPHPARPGLRAGPVSGRLRGPIALLAPPPGLRLGAPLVTTARARPRGALIGAAALETEGGAP